MAVFTDWASLEKSIVRQMDDVTKSARRFAKDMAKEGAELTEELTRTRPSERNPDQSKGRVDKGDMVDAITHGTESEDATHIRTWFGWDNPEPYYAFQTVTGFTFFDGVWVAPTYALRDATADVEASIDEWIARGGR